MAFYNGVGKNLTKEQVIKKLQDWDNQYKQRSKSFENQINAEFKVLYREIDNRFKDNAGAMLKHQLKNKQDRYISALKDGRKKFSNAIGNIIMDINAREKKNIAALNK